MSRAPGLGALVVALLVAMGPPALAREVTDATGAKVVVKDDVARVVTLAPSLGELAADLLDDDSGRIVGVSERTDYPPAIAGRTSVGPYFRFSLEKVISLKPDLVLATTDGNAKDQIEHLRELGVPVVTVKGARLADIEESILIAGAALGRSARAAGLVGQLRKGIERIRARVKGLARPRILLQVGDDPLVVAGKGTFLNEALDAAGGENAYGDLAAAYPRPTIDDVLSRDPEAIVILSMDGDLAPFRAMARRWERFPRLKAVKGKRVIVLRGDTVLRPSLRLLEGLDLLSRAVHPSSPSGAQQ